MNIYEENSTNKYLVINNKEFTSFEQIFHVLIFFLITHNSILLNVV